MYRSLYIDNETGGATGTRREPGRAANAWMVGRAHTDPEWGRGPVGPGPAGKGRQAITSADGPGHTVARAAAGTCPSHPLGRDSRHSHVQFNERSPPAVTHPFA